MPAHEPRQPCVGRLTSPALRGINAVGYNAVPKATKPLGVLYATRGIFVPETGRMRLWRDAEVGKWLART